MNRFRFYSLMVTIRNTDFNTQKATFCQQNVMMCSVKSHKKQLFPPIPNRFFVTDTAFYIVR